ncbi:unnamed protein product [Adineta steineri]|uniref:Uncharacterized protein n=1 Tax=Adineta steineri TaxID=433720 RepID=A0A814QXY8_9BILA|nr:unnamed protein product [Adineta steineri]CAF1210302.1 unnamed protein product [Adineta steineri]
MTSSSSTETTENVLAMYDQSDGFRVYKNKNIVFFGHDTMRSLYCDLARLLQTGNMLKNSSIKFHHTRHDPYVNETVLKKLDKCISYDRIDCRRYHSEKSCNTLYLIFIGSIMDDKWPIDLEWLQHITEVKQIDLVVTSCAYPDLCGRRLEKKNEKFDDKLPLFSSKLNYICRTFKLAFPHATMIWFPPLPTIRLDDGIQTDQFKQLVKTCFDIACNQHHFQYLKRCEDWINVYKILYLKDECYMSGEAVRELTTELGEYMATNWKRNIDIETEPSYKRFKT